MNRFAILLFITTLLLSSSCLLTPPIVGEGELIARDASPEPFEGITLNIPATVILSQGPTQSVKLEGQANILDNLSLDVSRGVCRIDFEKRAKLDKPLNLYITVPKINRLSINGSGDIKGQNKFEKLEDLELEIDGSGNIALEVETPELEAKINGSGNLRLDGSAKEFDIRINGSGDARAYGFLAKDAKVRISGSGDCQLNVEDDLEVKISGSGNVTYKGNPRIESIISGSGDVRDGN